MSGQEWERGLLCAKARRQVVQGSQRNRGGGMAATQRDRAGSPTEGRPTGPCTEYAVKGLRYTGKSAQVSK